MIDYRKYIKQRFSNELKLLIFLSQEELNQINCPGNLDDINWDEFLDLTLKHRLVSHVLKHAKFLAENIPIPTYEKLIDVRLEHSKLALNFTIHAIRIYQKFKENNISHCFFKGPLLSLELYNDIGYRNFRDIDILVEQKDAEKAKSIIEELDFKCIYPRIKLSEKQKKLNYSISHHYHFVHPVQTIDIELHWNITNPKSYFSLETKEIVLNSGNLKVSNYELPYISEVENLAYQAAHGAIHQWYRLFWLKDFSVFLLKADSKEIIEAYELSKKLKLKKCFIQACMLSNFIFNIEIPDFIDNEISTKIIKTPLISINSTDLSQRGFRGKIKFIFYRLQLKSDVKYYLDLFFRLRTHLTDWELIKLPESFFFLYYILRPFLLVYKFLKNRRTKV
ncbi:nucleotidyltransferase family protein [Bacteroidota bacterium]